MKFSFLLQGYTSQDPLGNLQDVTTVEVYANNTDDAIKKAKKLVSKQHWRVSQIIEIEENASSK